MLNHSKTSGHDHPCNTLMTPEQVASALYISIRTLAAWRSSGREKLGYIKIGGRVRYRRSDVDAWLASQSHNSTHTAQGGAQ